MNFRSHATFGVCLAALIILSAPLLAGTVLICSEPVSTGQGLIRGRDDPEYSACVWKGIPYAAPPVGELRWRAPEPPLPHSGVYDAYEFGASCPQDEVLTSGGESAAFSEDCLFINIWSPKKPGKYPVMYWIHGGGFREGAGTYDMYDGARLAAERDVVLVTINYRIGALGFMSLPELAEEDPHGSVGNYGIMDMIQGLKWVRDNIEGFQGDPDNVTIFGQSAGGAAVCILLASPPAAGLFHRAIPMSGGCDERNTLEHEYENGEKIAQEVGCTGPDRLECLRSQPAYDFVPQGRNLVVLAIKGGGWQASPNVDGYVLEQSPIEALRSGSYNKVPVMMGHTRDEIKLYTLVMPGVSLLPRFVINKIIKRVAKDKFELLMEHYSYKDYRHPSQLLFAVANEAYASAGYAAAQAIADEVPFYLYRFDWDQTRLSRKMGAFHGLDIPFVYGALSVDSAIAHMLASKKTYEQAEPLSIKIMSYYTNFAGNGDPNGPGLTRWPAYTLEKKERIYLDMPITATPLTQEEIEKYELFVKHGTW